MANERVAIEETYQIPGYALYKNPKLDKGFTLRAMTTVEERLRLSSTGFKTTAKIIRNCLTNNTDLDISDLKLFDIVFLMYKLRVVTYGSDYHVILTCPHCGKRTNLIVNLDDLKVTDVPEDFEEPIKIGPLPISGDILSCKIATLKDYLDILADKEKFMEKFPEGEDPSFFLQMQYRILEINGKQLPPFELERYVRMMHARDYQYYEREYDKAVESFGISTLVEGVCEHCNKPLTFNLPVTEEFFRPSYDD